MKFIKESLQSILKLFGYKIAPLETASPFDEIYSKLFDNRRNGSIIIFDVGSHRGESIERFRKIFPGSIVHAFEPEKVNFSILEKKYREDQNIILNNCGVGNLNGSLTYHSFEKTDVGGFHQIDINDPWTKIRSLQHGTTPQSFETSSYDVPVIKLDNYVNKYGPKHIHLLKIDTQGFEDEVLKGCSDTLKDNIIDFIELEIIIKGPYKKTLHFKDIENILSPLGYSLYGIKNGSSYYHSPILQFDILFAKADCYLEGDYIKQIQN